jgi:hypothetical protein
LPLDSLWFLLGQTKCEYYSNSLPAYGKALVKGSRVIRTLNASINLFIQNKYIYEPQKKNPRDKIHEDWGLISYDRPRETFVFRQFHIEGFVNQSLPENIAKDGQTISFVTEAIENIAPGWKAIE